TALTAPRFTWPCPPPDRRLRGERAPRRRPARTVAPRGSAAPTATSPRRNRSALSCIQSQQLARGGPDMEEIRKALEEQLRQTLDRIKALGGAVTLEDDGGQGEAAADAGRISEDREMGFAMRGLLVERANRLAEALERLRTGEYGTCQACGEPIAPARLRAIPEVTMCVACQDAAERRARVGAPELASR